MNRNRLLALARKVLDESSPEPERVTSGNMLAKEIVKLLTDGKTMLLTQPEQPEPVMNVAEREAADRAEHVVQQAVRKAEAKAHVQPGSEPTWVEFDPPSPGRAEPQFGGEFGKPVRRPRR